MPSKKLTSTLTPPASHILPTPPPTTNSLTNHVDLWEEELALSQDPDTQFLLDGIRHGFRLIDEGSDIKQTECQNYSSLYDGDNAGKVATQISWEIANGNYQVTQVKPTIVSALGAIPKPNGKIRLIHDCSRPKDINLNAYASLDPIKYESLQDGVKLLQKGYYMAKVDLESAYRSVLIHPDDHNATGVKFKFPGDKFPTYMFDRRLPFGAKKSPGIFNRITQSVKRMMQRRGFDTMIVYLDDWFIVAPTKAACQLALNELLRLLRSLGFSISYSKVVPPCTRLVFLGILIDSVSMTLSLPHEKVVELEALLTHFANSKHATKRQLQSLAGKLNWASQVVRGGRTFLRRIINYASMLVKPTHKIKLFDEFFADIAWWTNFFHCFHGQTISATANREVTAIEMDSCVQASGIVYGPDWLYTDWAIDFPTAAPMHINFKEALSVLLAARRWGETWRGKEVLVFSDNQAAIGMINKGSTRDEGMMVALRELFWWSAYFDFQLTAIYLPGISNIFADQVSRLGANKRLLQWALINQCSMAPPELDLFVSDLAMHMSPSSLLTFLPQIAELGQVRKSWILRSRDTEPAC